MALFENKVPVINAVGDIALTPESPTRTIDLSQVFSDPEGDLLKYEIIAGNSDTLSVELVGDRLNLTALSQAGITDVTIGATDIAGNSIKHTFSVTTTNLSRETTTAINNALNQIQIAVNQNPDDLLEALDNPDAVAAQDQIMAAIEENPDLIRLLQRPDILPLVGLNSSGVETLKKLLQSPEIADEFGISGTLEDALSQPDSTLLDKFLLNAIDALNLLPEDAKQPLVGIIDFTEGKHLQNVSQAFASINPDAKIDKFTVKDGNWAAELVKFVDKVRASGESHAVVNLSFDLSQLDDVGITTRYELTPEEQQAIQYARENNVLLVVAAGNTGGVMSALGAAAEQFNNIITVGAVTQFESKADYSAFGAGLSLMAPGGSWDDDPDAFVGTSRASAYIAAIAALVWGANSKLSLSQIQKLLRETAADLEEEGWDEKTGAGLVDAKEAISRALVTEGEDGQDAHPTDGQDAHPTREISEFSGEGRVKALARPASEATAKAISQLEKTNETLLNQWQTLVDLGNPALSLDELSAELKQKIAKTLSEYEKASVENAIAKSDSDQKAEALNFATQHYLIEFNRLPALKDHQKDLEELLAELGKQETALKTETQKLLDGIREQITQAEQDLAKAKAKLLNPLATNVETNPEALKTEA
ncbi:S8 family serine peptidase [Microseira sp. BLCC-F43]|uniref:S8 family peptidase n=1 Tax=Microseira sp. BLCC-F43 TaxID=3153602 RepID=UPI0035BA117A